MTVPSVAVVMPAATAQRLAVLAGLAAAAALGPIQALMESFDSAIRSPLRSSRPAEADPSPTPGSKPTVDSTATPSNDLSGAKLPATGDQDGDDVEAEHLETWKLVRAARDGDGEAFGRLYDKYVDAVFRFIYYRVNDRGLAEDFTSETFLRALRRISTINYQGRDIGAWFMTIARNIVFDHVKSARFRLETTTAEIGEGTETVASPELAVLTRLSNARLLAAVDELGDEQKECIVLRFLNGLSVAETATVMGKNDGAIKALQHRAVKRLAGILGDELQ